MRGLKLYVKKFLLNNGIKHMQIEMVIGRLLASLIDCSSQLFYSQSYLSQCFLP